MPLSITYNPAKNYSADSTYTEIVSRWVASDSPIVFKISNTKFPVNSEDTQYLVSTVTETGSGLSEIVMTSDHDFFVGQYVQIAGFTTTEYNGTFKVIDTPTADSIIIGVAFNDNFAFTAGAYVQRAYLNYHNRVRVYAGLPNGHRWQILKPMAEIGIVKSEPNSGNIAVFDIQEYVQAQIETPVVNDLTLVSLPNDVNLWTAFYIEYNEVYTDFAGGDGNLFDITAYGDSGGNAQLTLSGTNFDFQIGDSIVLSGFTDSIYNRVWEVVEVNDSTQQVTINYPYDPYFSLYGSEQAEGFSRLLRTIESAYTTDENIYYASKARVPFGNSYLQQALGNNLAQYLNIDPAETDDLAVWPTDFTDIAVFEGKYFDLTHYIDKSLTDSLAANEQITLEIKEFDFAGVLLATQYYKMNNQEEGVWRMPFLGSPPLPAPLAVIVQSTFEGGYVSISNGTTTVESTNGNAILLIEEGATIDIVLQGSNTSRSSEAAVLWAGVGNPSTPEDGGTWSNAATEFPHGISLGEQVITEKTISFIATQSNTIDADFFNRFAWAVTRHYKIPTGSAFSDISNLDDGKGYVYDSTVSSAILDTNAPKTTVSGLTELTGQRPTKLDATQTTPAKARQGDFKTFGGFDYLESYRGVTTGLLQTGAINEGDFLTSRLTNDGYGFITESGFTAVAGGNCDNSKARYVFNIVKPTDLTDAGNFSGVFDVYTQNVGAGAVGGKSAYMSSSVFRGIASSAGVASPYPDEIFLQLVYFTVGQVGQFGLNINSASCHWENTTNGVIQQDSANGGATNLNHGVTQNTGCVQNDSRSEPTATATFTPDSGFFESLTFIRALTNDQIEDVKSRYRTFYGI